jgi:anti-anti-sigma regulatory factor
MDFSLVELITSVSISNLLILKDMLNRKGKRLILTNVSFITKCVFTVTGVEDVFEFCDDKDQALCLLKQQPQQVD